MILIKVFSWKMYIFSVLEGKWACGNVSDVTGMTKHHWYHPHQAAILSCQEFISLIHWTPNAAPVPTLADRPGPGVRTRYTGKISLFWILILMVGMFSVMFQSILDFQQTKTKNKHISKSDVDKNLDLEQF